MEGKQLEIEDLQYHAAKNITGYPADNTFWENEGLLDDFISIEKIFFRKKKTTPEGLQ